eukprot:180824-Chlamydomonas_euryale.AAC.2
MCEFANVGWKWAGWRRVGWGRGTSTSLCRWTLLMGIPNQGSPKYQSRCAGHQPLPPYSWGYQSTCADIPSNPSTPPPALLYLVAGQGTSMRWCWNMPLRLKPCLCPPTQKIPVPHHLPPPSFCPIPAEQDTLLLDHPDALPGHEDHHPMGAAVRPTCGGGVLGTEAAPGGAAGPGRPAVPSTLVMTPAEADTNNSKLPKRYKYVPVNELMARGSGGGGGAQQPQ